MCFWQITRIWFIRFSQYCILWLLLMIFNYQEIFFVLIKVSCPRFRGIKVRNCAPNGFLPVSTKMGGSKLSSWAIFFRCMQFVCGEVGGGLKPLVYIAHCQGVNCFVLRNFPTPVWRETTGHDGTWRGATWGGTFINSFLSKYWYKFKGIYGRNWSQISLFYHLRTPRVA